MQITKNIQYEDKQQRCREIRPLKKMFLFSKGQHKMCGIEQVETFNPFSYYVFLLFFFWVIKNWTAFKCVVLCLQNTWTTGDDFLELQFYFITLPTRPRPLFIFVNWGVVCSSFCRLDVLYLPLIAIFVVWEMRRLRNLGV